MDCALSNEEAAKFVLLEWSLNPYPGSSGLTTDLLGTSLAQSLNSSAVTSNASPSAYWMTLAFTTIQNFSTLSRGEPLLNESYIPQCTSRSQGSSAL